MVCDTSLISTSQEISPVLILVFVEDGLRLLPTMTKPMTSQMVLILVFVEDGLRPTDANGSASDGYAVLILVFVEDGLRRI